MNPIPPAPPLTVPMRTGDDINALYLFNTNLVQGLNPWLVLVGNYINASLRNDGSVPLTGYTVAKLPSGVEGMIAYATNGRKVGEGAGAGTGVPVYYSNGHWRVYSTDATVSV